MTTQEKREIILATLDSVEDEMITLCNNGCCPLCIAALKQRNVNESRRNYINPWAKCNYCLIPGDEEMRCFDLTSKEKLVGLCFMLAMLNTGDL